MTDATHDVHACTQCPWEHDGPDAATRATTHTRLRGHAVTVHTHPTTHCKQKGCTR